MKPPRRRAGNRHAPQKSFLCISDFARADFFLLKGKENFVVLLCSDEQGGGLGLFLISLGRGGIPPPNPQYERIYWGFVFKLRKQNLVECRDEMRHGIPAPCRSE